MTISSIKNPQVKYLKQLQSKSKLRTKDNCFVVEGVREITMALKYGYQFKSILIADELYKAELSFPIDVEVIKISNAVYENLAYRSSTEGIIGLCESKSHGLSNLIFKNSTPLVLVLESPEKPGNIGAILRTADASGVDAIIIANLRTDLYNPNTIRSSLGAIFTNQLVVASSKEVIQFLQDQQIQMYSATLQNSNSYLKHDYTKPTAFIMGSEAYGLTDIWRNRKDIQAINIPMQGDIDSMNLSVSTAILTFEAVRQRS
jgi:TrmH family RNA methyltransferase